MIGLLLGTVESYSLTKEPHAKTEQQTGHRGPDIHTG
jgi:hypothetical protein